LAVRIWVRARSILSQRVLEGNGGKTRFSRKMAGTFAMIQCLSNI
jgi:hypothetical protein